MALFLGVLRTILETFEVRKKDFKGLTKGSQGWSKNDRRSSQLFKTFSNTWEKIGGHSKRLEDAHAESHWMSDQRINHYQGMP